MANAVRRVAALNICKCQLCAIAFVHCNGIQSTPATCFSLFVSGSLFIDIYITRTMCVRARVFVFAYLRARVPTFLCAYACLCVCVMECLASLQVRNAYTM